MWAGMKKGDPCPSVSTESPVSWQTPHPGQTWMTGYPSGRRRPKDGQLGSFYTEHMEVRRARAEAQNCFRRWSESRSK